MEFYAPIFSQNLKNHLQQKYNSFENGIICDWLYTTYLGEYESTIAYPKILHSFQFDQTINLSNLDRNRICKYLTQMIDDETDHTQILFRVLSEKFNLELNQDDLVGIQNKTSDLFNQFELPTLLLYYYIGECNLWTGFFLMHKNSKDVKISKIFHRLLVDESHHHNNIFKIFQKLGNSISFNNDYFLDEVRFFRYFGLAYVKNFFNLNNVTSQQTNWWLKLIYNHEWQQNFNLIFLKKTYRLYELFNKNSNFDNYQQIVNK